MYKNTKDKIIYPILMAVAVVAGIFIGMLFSARTGGERQTLGMRSYSDNKLIYLMSMINQSYVDSVNMDSLTEDVIPQLLADLDPHSVYIPKKNFSEANETLDGQFDGIGVVFNMATDTIIVLNVISAGPSDKAGIQNGDRIIMIGDSLVAGQKIPQYNIVKMLRGKRGTKVDLSIKRQGIRDLVPITVTRGVIPIKSLDAAFMIRPGIGFVKLSAFSKNSFLEVDAALDKLKAEGMTKLIFDLRGNSGGFLDQAFNIANEFLPEGKMIVYTEDRQKQREELFSDGKGDFFDIDIAILIDENSASSSEILAGAIQDNDRGVIVGRRSFGKGLVQRQFEFKDGSAVRLTIARYYTPTGRSIQRPYDQGNDAYALDMLDRYNHNEFFSADSIKFSDSLKFTTPAGRTVYGGGGIMPDVFVPLDTTQMSRYYREVVGRNILYKYTIEYSDRHRKELNEINGISELEKFLDSDKSLLNDFISYAAHSGVAPEYRGINHSRELILAQLRAYIGRNTQLEEAGFYSNIYKVDSTILAALDELNKSDN